MNVYSAQLNEDQFSAIAEMLYGLTGIRMKLGKEELVKARLIKRLRALGLESFDQYLRYVEVDGSGRELVTMAEALTTNKTSFFREPRHLEYLSRHLLPSLKGQRLRVWSAGCSSGEEPFTIAIILSEVLPERDRVRAGILATDISGTMLAKAREAVYDANAVREVPADLLRRYFTPIRQVPPAFRVNDPIRLMVRVARLNLVDDWPMSGPFHMIFCRNVMMYFDRRTQERLLRRFWKLLVPGGRLFVGHSESLVAATHPFCYVQPAVFRK